MTILMLIQLIKEEFYIDLNKWQRQFIDDIYEGIDGLEGITDDELSEYLTEKQMDKVEEIAHEVGIF